MTDLATLLGELAPAIADRRVLEALAAVPREAFVPPALRDRAYENVALEIDCGQTISQPLVVARMLELLGVRRGDRVLDVGTGSGYHAALLARLGATVWSIERHRTLSAQAAGNLAAAGIDGVTLIVGDGTRGHPGAAPYDAINVAAAVGGDVPAALEAQLADGGRLVAPLGDGEQRLALVRSVDGRRERVELEPVRFVPLVAERRAFTAGHSTRSAAELTAILCDAGVRTVADVRTAPGSRRNPDAAQEALERWLPDAGIAYVHLPELGGRRRPAPDSPNDGWEQPAFRGYADHMASAEFAAGLARLEELAERAATAVMCAEAVWWRCHRRLIADALVVRGWRVEHLGVGGRAPVEHELTPFAVVAGRRLRYPAPQGSLEV